MQYGPLTNSDAGFRAVCLTLAQHPAYANAPLRLVLDMREILRRNQTFCAVEGDELRGFIAWSRVPVSAALQAIRDRKWPRPPFQYEPDYALALVALIAPAHEDSLGFIRRFVRSQSRRIIIFERHGAARPARLKWFDRAGRLMGGDL